MTTPTLIERLEAVRKDQLIDGCMKIDADLGGAVEEAFRAGYCADEVHAMLSAGNALNRLTALRASEQDRPVD